MTLIKQNLLHNNANLLMAAALLFCLFQAGCGDSGGTKTQTGAAPKITIQNKGSDTMVNLAQAWAEEYKKAAPDVSVEVSGGGSGVGIAALTKGTIDIANASRNMKPEEIQEAKKNTGKEPKEFIVGYDALAIYVHKDNPINEITLDQIAQIYAEGGNLTKWSQLGVTIPGVSNDEIVRVSRQSNSGTYEFLREHVLNKKDFKLGSRDMNGSKEVVALVASTPTAIGYSGMGYATPVVKMLKVKKTAADPAFEPNTENTLSKTYPIARTLQIYTLGDPQGATNVYVYNPDRGRVYARRIDVGLPVGGEVEIRSGLNGDEQIVVAGQQKIREGSLVQIAGGAR